MPTFALDLEFDGSAFAGTAPQPDRPTLTGSLRASLAELGEDGALTRTCGRLDTGVSACSLVTSCILQRSWDAPTLGLALNAKLPPAIRVLRVATVEADWDALRQTTGKIYAYRVLHRDAAPALDSGLHWVWGRFDATKLNDCAAAIIGRHDLSAFACLRNDGSDPADPVRSILGAQWRMSPWSGDGTLHEFTVAGTGFLYKQVRGLVGAMLAVAQGSASLERFRGRIGAGSADNAERRVGQIAPACGLRLVEARFDPEPAWQRLRPGG